MESHLHYVWSAILWGSGFQFLVNSFLLVVTARLESRIETLEKTSGIDPEKLKRGNF